MKFRVAAALVPLALILSACGGNEDSVDEANPQGSDVRTTSVSASGGSHIDKEIGEPAGVENPETGAEVFAIAIESIERTNECLDLYGEMQDGNFLAVDMRVRTNGLPILDTQVISPDKWTIVDSDGTDHAGVISQCDGAEQLLSLDETGEREVSVYFNEPSNAHALRLNVVRDTGEVAGWQWALPEGGPTESVVTSTPAAEVGFECGDPMLYQPGTALYSDGTTGYESSCE